MADFATLNTTVSDLSEEFTSTIGLFAQEVNQSFTLSSGYLVFFMQCGFAMLCSGSVRAKNAKNIILLNLLDSCFGVMCWYMTGFAFAFGDKVDAEGVNIGNGFIGTQHFFLTTYPTTSSSGGYWFWFFQFAFAATGATIISGVIAERARFEFYLIYELLIVCWVYPVIAHWQWTASGWISPTRITGKLLFGSGTIDYAGDGPVHMIGGVAGLWAGLILGPRIGRFNSDGTPNDMPGHNASLTILGVFVLWFGWYGFNPGSVNSITGATLPVTSTSALPGQSPDIGVVGNVAMATTLSAACGGIGCLFACFIHNYVVYGVQVWDLIMCGNGVLGGLVGITSGCATLAPWGAVITGLTSGVVYFYSSKFNLYILKLDDPLDAVPVHMWCGMWGLIMTGCWSTQSRVSAAYGTRPDNGGQRDHGIFTGGDGRLFACELIQILTIFGFVSAFCIPVFLLTKWAGLMRVTPEYETTGLDVSMHGGHAYPGEETTEKVDSASILNSAAFDRKLQAAIDKAIAANGNGKGV